MGTRRGVQAVGERVPFLSKNARNYKDTWGLLGEYRGVTGLMDFVSLPRDDDSLVDESVVASIFGCEPRTMRQKRYDGTGPKYVRISKNKVMYRAGAVREFIRSREYGSTSEESQGGAS